MKIVIIGPAYPYRGGIADTNESFCRALNNIGYEATLMTFSLQYPSILFPGKTQFSENSSPTDITISREISTVNPVTWFSAAAKIKKQKPDLVIVRYWLPFLAPSLGTIARRLSKKVKIVALCDNIIPHEKRLGDYMLTKYFVKPFDGFITMSATVKDELSTFTSKPQLCRPHPINDNLGNIKNRTEACEELGLDPSYEYLLFFGLVRKYKGLDLTLKAISDPLIKNRNIKLIVAGEWYDKPAQYDSLIEDLGIKDKVIIRNEFIASSDIQYYFSAADLVIQTYHTASQSGVTQIAMHFEKPILVTDVGGLSETVKHRELGFVTSKDPAEIAKSINEYFTVTDRLEMKQKINSEKNNYTWESFGEAVVQKFLKN